MQVTKSLSLYGRHALVARSGNGKTVQLKNAVMQGVVDDRCVVVLSADRSWWCIASLTGCLYDGHADTVHSSPGLCVDAAAGVPGVPIVMELEWSARHPSSTFTRLCEEISRDARPKLLVIDAAAGVGRYQLHANLVAESMGRRCDLLIAAQDEADYAWLRGRFPDITPWHFDYQSSGAILQSIAAFSRCMRA